MDREQLVVTCSVTLDERPPSRYKNIVVSENRVEITQHHDDRDENAVNAPISADLMMRKTWKLMEQMV